MKKRLFSLILSGILAASLLGCCSAVTAETSDPADWPTVSFPILPVVEVTDEAEVEQALNDYLVSIDAGVKADAVLIDFGSVSQVMTLMLSSREEPIDVFSYNFFSSLTGVVKNDQVIPLDDMLETYPDLVDTIGEEYLALGKIGNTQYAFPTVGAYANTWWYVLRQDVAEEIGVADRNGEKITLDQLDEILALAKEAHPEYSFFPTIQDLIYVQDYEVLGDNDWMGAIANSAVDGTEIINYYDTDDFEALCRRCADYAEKGYFMNDPLNQTHDKSHYKNGVTGGTLHNAITLQVALDDMRSSYGQESVAFQLSDLTSNCNYASGSGWCVSAVSQNPDAAKKFLYLLYTDENVMRFIAQGLEGKHYVLDDKGCSWYPEGKSMGDLGWSTGAQWYFPNQTLTIPFNTENANLYVDMKQANVDARHSQCIGFVFDSEPVYDQYVAVDSVIKEYRDALLFGQVDVDDILPMFREELIDAGIEDVIAEKQAQLDAFLAE